MKLIGLFGGMSWIATVPYYERLNRMVAEHEGAPNAARILLYSVNYGEFKTLYHHGWDRIPGIFEKEYRLLMRGQPDCVILANNTLHKAYDLVADRLPKTAPFFHAVHLTRDYCLANKIKHALFVGTAFTMKDAYFFGPLHAAGVTLTLPTEAEQQQIQEIQTGITNGDTGEAQKTAFARIIERYNAVDGVILACTELPLIAPHSTPQCPMINPVELQCQAAVNFALSEDGS
jgi:aspartate racemase